MALEEYQRKRDFRKTPEPAGAAAARPAAAAGLSFVIQKHAARRLHYDFRLELDGVLKSWAVPKGPSLDPAEKRLAVHVEDHPLEYGGFEGVIPKGQYGGGTVLLWDRGTWAPLKPGPGGRPTARARSNSRLHGEKLHGNWALVRMGGKAASERHENWLLIKERDDEALPRQRRRGGRRQPAQRRQRPVDGCDRRRPRPGVAFAARRNGGDKPPRPAQSSRARETAAHRAAPARRAMPERSSRSSRRWSRRRPRATNGCTRSNMTAIACSPASRTAKVRLITRRRSRLDRQVPGAGRRARPNCRSTPR